MRFELLFPSKYVKGADFADGPKTLTIKSVVQDNIVTDRGTEKKAIVYFEEMLDKALILNVTNAKSIAKMYGPEVNDWTGKRVTLIMAQAQAKGGEMVDCVRIKPGIPSEPAKKVGAK